MSKKLPSLSSIAVLKVLKRAGFKEDHRTGSHIIPYHAQKGLRIVVPYHRRDLPKGTTQAILRAAGLDRETTLKLLKG